VGLFPCPAEFWRKEDTISIYPFSPTLVSTGTYQNGLQGMQSTFQQLTRLCNLVIWPRDPSDRSSSSGIATLLDNIIG
jgi:hypothetical protein